MARILLVYGTRQGHTAHIAEEMAVTLRSESHDVDVRNLPSEPAPEVFGYDAIIVGASVHARGFEREVRHWVASHAADLAVVPNGFFSVSLTSANHDTKSNDDIDAVINQFSTQTGWWPQLIGRFAGALVYSQYNWFLKRMMRWIVRRESNGDYTDMSRDYDLTDYDEVTAFAKTFADLAQTREASWA